MHEIKKHIIKKLSLSKSSKYSELKPKNVDGNLFVYHLGVLKKQGYVEKKDDLYSLTSSGRHLLSRTSFENFKERIQPVIVTTIIIEKNGKYLLYRQKRAPFINKVSFPYGKIHLEERLKEAAERELKDKSGLVAKLTHRGDVYITLHNETQLVTQTLHHVFSGKDISGELRKDYEGGECFWASFEEVDSADILPGAKKMLDLVKKHNNDHFFAEYFLNTTD